MTNEDYRLWLLAWIAWGAFLGFGAGYSYGLRKRKEPKPAASGEASDEGKT